MIVELAADVARKIFQSATLHIEVLTEILDPQPVRLRVMAPDRLFSRFDQTARQFLADLVRAVVDDPCKLFHGYALERRRRWIARKNRGSELALESPNIPCELWKAKINRPHHIFSSASRLGERPREKMFSSSFTMSEQEHLQWTPYKHDCASPFGPLRSGTSCRPIRSRI